EGHEHPGRLPLLQLGGSVQRFGTRGEHAFRDGVQLRLSACAKHADERMDPLPGSVSARVLRPRHGRTHRRSEHEQLEGAWIVVELRYALRVAYRRREGYEG